MERIVKCSSCSGSGIWEMEYEDHNGLNQSRFVECLTCDGEGRVKEVLKACSDCGEEKYLREEIDQCLPCFRAESSRETKELLG